MSEKSNTFQNDHVTVSLTREAGCRIKAEVSLNSHAVAEARLQSLKSLKKKVSIPGFRKGKAPDEMVLKHYSDALDKEFKEDILDVGFREALKLTNEAPYSKNSIYAAKVKTLSNEGAELFYDYEVAPEVPLMDGADFTLDSNQKEEITDKDVGNYLDNLLVKKATWNEITDRPVQEFDFIDIDIETVEENPKKLFEKTRVHVAPVKMDAWMRKLVIGANVGDVVEGLSENEAETPPCDSCESGEEHTHHDTFTPTLLKIKIYGLYEGVVPELDDEVAKQYGATSADDLKTKARTNLVNYAAEQARQAKRSEIFQQIVMKYPFEVPLSPAHMYIRNHMEAIQKEFQQRGVSEEDGKKQLQNLFSKIVYDMHMKFLFDKFAEAHKLNVTNEEVSWEWTRHLWAKSAGQQTMALAEDPKEAMGQIAAFLMRQKVLDTLIKEKEQLVSK